MVHRHSEVAQKSGWRRMPGTRSSFTGQLRPTSHKISNNKGRTTTLNQHPEHKLALAHFLHLGSLKSWV
jgi:hypothetical protein